MSKRECLCVVYVCALLSERKYAHAIDIGVVFFGYIAMESISIDGWINVMCLLVDRQTWVEPSTKVAPFIIYTWEPPMGPKTYLENMALNTGIDSIFLDSICLELFHDTNN